MRVELKFKPAFTALFAQLAPGDAIIAESDAMASMSSHTRIKTCFNGGFFVAWLRKIFGHESLFINEYSCPQGSGEAHLVLTQPTPGDVVEVNLAGTALFLQPGAFIACDPTVAFGVGWAGFRSWFAGEGIFRLRVSGQGRVWLGAYGGIVPRTVTGAYIVDTGHLLAYEPTLRLNIVLSGGIFSSFFGGEGFVSRMEGQGRLYMQSRSLDGLAAWTNSQLF
jgi:uncharacterized protein (TIGR00266 family)